jgi:hypothetical protein
MRRVEMHVAHASSREHSREPGGDDLGFTEKLAHVNRSTR